MAASAAYSIVRATSSCTGISRAQGNGVQQGLVALQAAKQFPGLSGRSHERGVSSRAFAKVSAVAANGAAADVAEAQRE